VVAGWPEIVSVVAAEAVVIWVTDNTAVARTAEIVDRVRTLE
jgi:hypothetical protein